jgi:hypothetical protein
MSEPNEPRPGPEWLTDTPAEQKYLLIVDAGDGLPWSQYIELTRDEYMQLKRRLAEMRGHTPLKTAQGALTERIAKLAELRGFDLELIEAAVQACELFTGSTSPAEEFLRDVCRAYRDRQLDPDFAEFALKTFRDNLQDMVKYTAEFARTNPREFKEICANLAATEKEADRV